VSQIESGIRSILSQPQIYDLLQNILGAKKVRTSFVRDYVKAKDKDNVLDIGCGTAQILSFINERINYFGFDQSSVYIESAKSKYGARGSFKCALVNDVEIEALPDMDIVLANGLIHHLDDSQTKVLLQTAEKSLLEKGRFIAIDPCYEDGQNFFAKWLISKDRGENVRKQSEYEMLAKEVFSNVESHVVHRKWIPYTHHILVCTK